MRRNPRVQEPLTILKKTALLASLVFCIAGASRATTLFQQLPGPNSNGAESSSTLDAALKPPGYITADQFQIAGGGTVTTVDWWGVLLIGSTSFQITFYSDASGQPGSALSTQSVSPTTSSQSVGSIFDPVTFYSTNLSTPFTAAPGTTYWMSIFDTASSSSWAWLNANTTSVTSQQELNGTTTWTPIWEVSFELDSATPEPATAALIGMAIFGLAGCRRMRAARRLGADDRT